MRKLYLTPGTLLEGSDHTYLSTFKEPILVPTNQIDSHPLCPSGVRVDNGVLEVSDTRRGNLLDSIPVTCVLVGSCDRICVSGVRGGGGR